MSLLNLEALASRIFHRIYLHDYGSMLSILYCWYPHHRKSDGTTSTSDSAISTFALQTLNLFLQCTEEYLSEYNPTPDVSEDIVIIDTKDITTITKGSSPHITSSPTAFLGHTLQEVHDWFDANITQPRPKRFMHHCFLVLDDKSAEDESCIFVCTQVKLRERYTRCGVNLTLH